MLTVISNQFPKKSRKGPLMESSRDFSGFRHALYALGPDMESCLFFSPFFRTEPSGTDLL